MYYVLYNVSRVQRFCLTDFVSGNETDEKRNRADSHVRLHYRCLLLFEMFANELFDPRSPATTEGLVRVMRLLSGRFARDRFASVWQSTIGNSKRLACVRESEAPLSVRRPASALPVPFVSLSPQRSPTSALIFSPDSPVFARANPPVNPNGIFALVRVPAQTMP